MCCVPATVATDPQPLLHYAAEAAFISRTQASVAIHWLTGSPSTRVHAINVSRNAVEMLAEHTTLKP